MILTERELQTVAYYDQNAERWAGQRKKTSEPSFWSQEYAQFQELKSCGKILEIGSGSGREALEWIGRGYEYVGIDLSKELLKIARQMAPEGDFFYAAPYDLPFERETFDAFSSWALLPHVPKGRIEEALGSIQRVLKPNAVGFVAMREGEGEKEEAATGRWFSYYSEKEFEEVLERTGFQVLQRDKKPSRVDLVWLTFIVRSPTFFGGGGSRPRRKGE